MPHLFSWLPSVSSPRSPRQRPFLRLHGTQRLRACCVLYLQLINSKGKDYKRRVNGPLAVRHIRNLRTRADAVELLECCLKLCGPATGGFFCVLFCFVLANLPQNLDFLAWLRIFSSNLKENVAQGKSLGCNTGSRTMTKIRLVQTLAEYWAAASSV